jgi:hypothetical protein
MYERTGGKRWTCGYQRNDRQRDGVAETIGCKDRQKAGGSGE